MRAHRVARPPGLGGDWRDRAACRDADPDLFLPISENPSFAPQIAAAKSCCRRCPVQANCLEQALAHPWLAGVWGGLSETERRVLVREGGVSAQS